MIIGGGLAIGEKMDKYSVMTYVLNSKDFAITGGEFGIESSVISLFGYIIVAGIAFFMIKSRKIDIIGLKYEAIRYLSNSSLPKYISNFPILQAFQPVH